MGKGRLEAFSDGVIAIIITIMVLELRPPEETTWAALGQLQWKFLTYALSFVFLGIYWNNHHHMLHVVGRINGAVLWANLHLLFWLSLVPFVTAWMGEHHFEPVPTAAYGIVLLMAAVAYTILARLLIAVSGPQSQLARALGSDRKGHISLLLYAVAIPAAFVHKGISDLLYVTVALVWLVPDRRIERILGE
jgi:TMEM175 potassium channel family protein